LEVNTDRIFGCTNPLIISLTLTLDINAIWLSLSVNYGQIQRFRSNDCEIMIMLKHNQHHQIPSSICSSGYYNSCTTAKQPLKLTI